MLNKNKAIFTSKVLTKKTQRESSKVISGSPICSKESKYLLSKGFVIEL